MMPHNIHWVEELISSDNRIITYELRFTVSICKGSVMAIIKELGYSKVCTMGETNSVTHK